MSNKYLFYILIAVCVALVGLTGGSAYLANQMLAKQSKKLVQLRLQSQDISQQKINLSRAEQDIAKYSSLETVAKTIVPQDKDQAEAVRELVNIAQSSGISLSSVTFSASTLGSAKAPTTGASGTATPVVPQASKLTQVTPVAGIPGVYDLQINVTQSSDAPVTYNSFITFLSRLESNRRTAQVSSINLLPDAKNPSVLTFTLTIDEYIKP